MRRGCSASSSCLCRYLQTSNGGLGGQHWPHLLRTLEEDQLEEGAAIRSHRCSTESPLVSSLRGSPAAPWATGKTFRVATLSPPCRTSTAPAVSREIPHTQGYWLCELRLKMLKPGTSRLIGQQDRGPVKQRLLTLSCVTQLKPGTQNIQ